MTDNSVRPFRCIIRRIFVARARDSLHRKLFRKYSNYLKNQVFHFFTETFRHSFWACEFLINK